MLKRDLEVGAKKLSRSGLIWDRGMRSQIRRLLYTTIPDLLHTAFIKHTMYYTLP